MKEDTYAIMNLEKYADFLRNKVAQSFSEEYSENLDDFVTIKQTCQLIEEHSKGKDESGRLLISESGYEKLFEAVTNRVYNCGLSKLASKDLIECAWDNEKNEMVFWGKPKPK